MSKPVEKATKFIDRWIVNLMHVKTILLTIHAAWNSFKQPPSNPSANN